MPAVRRILANHEAAVALNYFAYNFVRIHRTLQVSPTMAAGVANRLCDISVIVVLLEEKPNNTLPKRRAAHDGSRSDTGNHRGGRARERRDSAWACRSPPLTNTSKTRRRRTGQCLLITSEVEHLRVTLARPSPWSWPSVFTLRFTRPNQSSPLPEIELSAPPTFSITDAGN